jgi:cell division protein FtsI/penicillin-binding protein 2
VERTPHAGMTSQIRTRVFLFTAGVAAATLVLAWRLVELQVVDADRLKAKAERQHQHVIEVGGRRGSIVDRDGCALAVSVTTDSLYAHPQRVKDPDRAARLLAPVLRRPVSELIALLKSDEPFVWLSRRMDPETARVVRRLDLPVGTGQAIDFQEEPKRFYPQGSLAVHVVGFADLDQKGIEGIERRFDDTLQGDSAKFLAVRDARGTMLLQPLRPPSKRSEDVVLSLDLVLQHFVERELDRAMSDTGARAASAILLAPKTGEVLALANRPTVDPVAYGKSRPEARRDRAVTDCYEPGSTFKIVSASAAFDRGAITPEQRFNCTSYTVAGKTYSDVHKLGLLSVREILEHSSNVGMVQVGRAIPKEALIQTILDFGFGRRTGIELPGERSGTVPKVSRMSATSSSALSIGYEVNVTPLQVASAFATIANEGLRVPPRIVLGTRDEDGTFHPAEKPAGRRAVSARTAVTMMNILEGVVLRGTGKNAQEPGYHIAGKTGTAKKVIPGGVGYTANEYFASFGGFGPLRDPALVCFVVLDTPRGGFVYGGQVAAPVFARIMANALAYLRVPPDDDAWKGRRDELQALAEREAKRKAAEARRRKSAGRTHDDAADDPSVAVAAGPGLVPDLRGKSAREAVVALTSRGYRARLTGQGVVLEQAPPAGSALAAGQACAISLGEPKETR